MPGAPHLRHPGNAYQTVGLERVEYFNPVNSSSRRTGIQIRMPKTTLTIVPGYWKFTEAEWQDDTPYGA
jgi:hypothetical protein